MATDPKDLLLNLELLQYYDEKLKAYIDGRFKLVKKDEPNEGAAVTYILQTNEATPKIIGEFDIPKDKFIRSIKLITVEEDDKPQEGMKKGEKYIEITVDAEENDVVYLPASDLNLDFQFATKPDIDALFPELNGEDVEDEESFSIALSIKWDDAGNDTSRPLEGVKVNLMKNDVAKLSDLPEEEEEEETPAQPVKTVTLKGSDGWTATWDEIEGDIGDYTVVVDESNLESYEVTVGEATLVTEESEPMGVSEDDGDPTEDDEADETTVKTYSVEITLKYKD